MPKLAWYGFLLIFLASFSTVAVAQSRNNNKVSSAEVSHTFRSLYDGSYALVIGVGAYRGSNWTPLNNVVTEAKSVAEVLEQQGFKVTFIQHPDGVTLSSAFKQFFATYGRNPRNRLVIFYSGHGHTIDDIGYLVPTDAPDPNLDESGFLHKAHSMQSIVYASKEFRALHALFIFDSCFSGAIFSSRSYAPDLRLTEQDIAKYIETRASHPVRQFITAGNEEQKLPQISQFTPLLVRALSGEVPEIVQEGLIMGRGLGSWLEQKMAFYSRDQSPRSGTILDSRFDRGEIVFQVAPKIALEKVSLFIDTMFDFNKAVLKPRDKQALDEFVTKLKGVKYDNIVAVGYADRSEDDVIRLSLRRVEASKAYLVKEKGISDNKILIHGMGKANPVTGDSCKGEEKTQTLINCLSPDRRVEMEVSGSRVRTQAVPEDSVRNSKDFQMQPPPLPKSSTNRLENHESQAIDPYWYYCIDPKGYFPNVKECPGGWHKVTSRFQPPPQENHAQTAPPLPRGIDPPPPVRDFNSRRLEAEQGVAAAQYNFGEMYQNGTGVPKDSVKAAEWFRKAAEQGFAPAQTYLGWMYQNGAGVPQDDAKAAEWYRKAAQQGDASAQFNLALMYQYGTGVPKDYVKAVEWYRKAAEQGHASAQFDLALMYRHGTGWQDFSWRFK